MKHWYGAKPNEVIVREINCEGGDVIVVAKLAREKKEKTLRLVGLELLPNLPRDASQSSNNSTLLMDSKVGAL
jgi:hypothetical protein